MAGVFDYVVRFLVDNSRLARDLQNSRNLMERFSAVGRSATDMLGRFAGAVGITYGGIQLFNTAVNSSQETLDGFRNLVESATSVLTAFWSSLNDGKPTQFLSNISVITAAARKAYAELNRLKNVNIFGDSEIAKIHADLERLSMRVDNTNLSEAERKAASKEKEELLKRERELINKKATQYQNTYVASLRKSMAEQGITDLSDDELLKMFGTLESYEKLVAKYSELKKKIDKGTTTTLMNSIAGAYTKETKNTEAKSIEESREYKIAKAVSRVRKEDLELSKSYEAASYLAWEDFYTKQHEDLNERLGLYNEYKAGGNPKSGAKSFLQPQAKYPNALAMKGFGEFSIADYEARLADLYNKIKNAPTLELRLKFSIEAEEVERKIAELSDYTKDSFGKSLDEAFRGENAFGAAIEKSLGKILKKSGKFKFDFSGLNDAISAFQNLGSSIAGCNEKSKELLKGMIGMSAVASIASLISIMVEKSKKSLTIWDWIAGITAGTATVVAVAAQLKALNAYASGGIVESNSTIGDMNLARVNGGEMILNNHQQRNLFSLLNNGGSTGGGSNGKVEFKIAGRELVGVLKNYNNKISKVQ